MKSLNWLIEVDSNQIEENKLRKDIIKVTRLLEIGIKLLTSYSSSYDTWPTDLQEGRVKSIAS